MKAVLVLCALAAIAIVASARATGNEWETFKASAKMSDKVEVKQRPEGSHKNVEIIKAHNEKFEHGVASLKAGINQITNMTPEELKNGLKNSEGKTVTFSLKKSVSAPTSVDWRNKGCVTPVSNQAQMGKSLAFVVADSIADVQCVATGKLEFLSVQQLVDCAPNAISAEDYFKYVMSTNGLDTETSYPAGGDGTCKFNPDTVGATIRSFSDVVNNELALKDAVAKGPVAALINASLMSFQTYVGGIYSDPNCDSNTIDHAVLVIGYGTEDGTDYWIVKNSWGAGWGESGYIRIARNANNLCGIASFASYPIV